MLDDETSSWLIGYYTSFVGAEEIFYGVPFAVKAVHVEICMNVNKGNFPEAREDLSIVMCRLWPEARPKKAGPKRWLERA